MNFMYMYWDVDSLDYYLPKDIKTNAKNRDRYVRVIRGSDIFVETWETGNRERLDVAYTKASEAGRVRLEMAERYGVALYRLVRRHIPAKLFDKIWSGLSKEE